MLLKLRILFTILSALCVAAIVPVGAFVSWVGAGACGLGSILFFMLMILCKQSQEMQEELLNPQTEEMPSEETAQANAEEKTEETSDNATEKNAEMKTEENSAETPVEAEEKGNETQAKA